MLFVYCVCLWTRLTQKHRFAHRMKVAMLCRFAITSRRIGSWNLTSVVLQSLSLSLSLSPIFVYFRHSDTDSNPKLHLLLQLGLAAQRQTLPGWRSSEKPIEILTEESCTAEISKPFAAISRRPNKIYLRGCMSCTPY